MLIKNGTLITPEKVVKADILIENGRIKKIKKGIKKKKGIRVIDASGRIVMPGLICAHHHLYSTFARGMSLKGKPARNFPEILEKLWWRLDKTLKPGDLYYSSVPVLIDAVKHGITTIIDHHESQGYQIGSLDEIAQSFKDVGIRGCLCLGASDRYGKGEEGLKENERFLSQLSTCLSVRQALNSQLLLKGMVGLHASFTVNDETLRGAVEISKKFKTGIHIHCAEDKSDQRITERKYGRRVIERLYKAGALGKKTIAVHCIHLDDKEINLLKKTDTIVVHNPESNMNNAVGWANVLKMIKKGILVGLGTDGMSSNMFREMRVAYLISHHENKDPRVGFFEAVKMLMFNNPVIAERIFGVKIGVLKEGAVADVVIFDYLPPTPLNSGNIFGHILFGLVDANVLTVVCNGKVIFNKGRILTVDEEKIAEIARKKAFKLWKRI